MADVTHTYAQKVQQLQSDKARLIALIKQQNDNLGSLAAVDSYTKELKRTVR